MTLFLLLLRRFSSRQHPLLLRGASDISRFLCHHYFSSVSSPHTSSTSSDQPKPSSLSARMSFVFDQIDAIERERSQKDETLQRIRVWRESKREKETNTGTNQLSSSPELNPNPTGLYSVDSEKKEKEREDKEGGGLMRREVELVHPWPEWIELMERLVRQNYFDHRRKDEDKMIETLGFDMPAVAEEGFDFTRDWKTVQTALLNFGRDRFDILRSLSRHDIQILVGYGCPSIDKKVVFSAKLLRKHVHFDEGNVCSSCSLRSSCERAYLLTNKEDEARTIDVMRVLLQYGFDPVNGSVNNKSLLKIKSVKTAVRKLLHEVVKLSAVPIDPNLPPPVIKKPPPKVKQPPPPPKKRVGRDDIEMKKGDWLCPKCDFMNFAKNTVCLQCDAKRPNRQLLPGEWECPSCNFLNYRRNMVCFHCECNRPPDELPENQMQERLHRPRTRLGNVVKGSEVSNAWNFNFDDDESDGADVAAFEYADSQKLDEDFPLDGQPHGENVLEDDLHKGNRTSRSLAKNGVPRPGTGFDDFDEEEDDVDSYELDTRNNNQVRKTTSINFSELEVDSEPEDIEGADDSWVARGRTESRTRNKRPKPMREKVVFSGSVHDDSDEDFPAHLNRKSSHGADYRRQSRGRGLSGDIEKEDILPRKNKGNKWSSSRKDFGRRGNHNVGDEPSSGLDSDEPSSGLDSDDEEVHTGRRRLRGNRGWSNRVRNPSKGLNKFDVFDDSQSRSNGMMWDRRRTFRTNFNRRSYDFDRGFQGDDYNGCKRERFGNLLRERFNDYDHQSGVSSFDGDRYRRPRVNVR